MEHPAHPPEKAREVLLAEAERIAGMGSWVWDARSGTHEWSANLYRLLGFEPGAVVPSNEVFFSVIIEGDRQRVQAAMGQAAEQSAAPREPVEYRVTLPGGEVRTLHSRVIAVRDDDGDLLRFVGTVTDETEAIERRRERESAREVLEISQQIAKIGSFIWDPLTEETTSSAENLRIVGAEEAMSMEMFAKLVHPDDLPALFEMREQVFTSGAAGPTEVRFTRPDGERRHIELQARAMGADPRTSPHVGIIHDVTDRVRLEQELRLSQTLEATGRLAAGVAHDFNNLLMVVMNHALDLADERPDERLDQIVSATESGAEMVRRLLTFGRQAPREPQVIDVSETVRDMAGWLGRLLGDGVTVELELAEEPLFVRADPAQLHQVLLNLAVNARDAMPDGGTVAMNTSATGERAVLTVQDEGIGMSDDVRRHAFDPFFSTKAVGEGTGLGLSMAYGVVTRLAGSVRISSREERGTRVVIELPRVRENGAPRASEVAPKPSKSSQCTVLLVEDDEAVRGVAVRMLELKGHTVITAADPDEAAARWKETRPDIVLSDLAMPHGGGERVARLLAVDHPSVPIVFMTGHAPEEGTLPGPILLKPFRAENLFNVIDETLNGTN